VSLQPARAFAGLWVASTLSSLGDGVTQVAGPLLAVTLTHDPFQVGALVIAQQLPWTLFALPGGAVVDRTDRGRLMMLAAALRAAGLATLGALVITGTARMPLLYGVFFVMGCAGVLYDSATVAVLPAVVARSEVLLAAPLGGWLFAVNAGVPFLFDSASFAMVAALAVRLCGTVRGTSIPPQRLPFGAAMVTGVRWIAGHRVLRMLAVSVCLTNLALGGVEAVLVLMARQRLGLGPVGFGLLTVGLAVGGVTGGLVAARLVRAIGAGAVLRAGLLLQLPANVGLALTHQPVVAAALLSLYGVHGALFATISASLRQAITPPDLLGRVQGAHRLMSRGGVLVGAACGGLLAGGVALVAPFWLGASVSVVLLLVGWGSFSNRTIAEAREAATGRQ
jgi:MFS family permease